MNFLGFQHCQASPDFKLALERKKVGACGCMGFLLGAGTWPVGQRKAVGKILSRPASPEEKAGEEPVYQVLWCLRH